jgi:hypothetical protein
MSEEKVEKKPRKKKPDGITKIIRIELTGSDGDFVDEKKRLLSLAVQMQQMANDYCNHWLCLHQQAGHHLVIRNWIEKDKEWAKAYKGKKDAPPRIKCPVNSCDPAMSRQLYRLLTREHANLGTKPIGIILQNVGKTISSMPSSKSAYKRWMTILSGLGEFPQAHKPAPIPFYTSNSSIIVPKTIKDPWKLEVRFERGLGTRLRPMVFKMRTGGRNLATIREALLKIASGEFIFNTSSLVLRDGRWYAHICYKITNIEKSQLDATKTAFVTAGYHNSMMMRINGRTLTGLMDSRHIERVRKSLTQQRFGKNESYKYASSARKGHGRKPIQWRDKIRDTWRDMVKTTNSCWAADVVKRCVKSKIGHVVVYQPAGKWRESRYLTNIGKMKGFTESTGWDWYQMQLLLQHACKVVGIKVTVRKIGESRKSKLRKKKAA